jgi:hypothetical protein
MAKTVFELIREQEVSGGPPIRTPLGLFLTRTKAYRYAETELRLSKEQVEVIPREVK